VQDATLDTMLAELDVPPDVFGIGPRMSWDGEREIPAEVRRANPDICDARLHPCCALVKNTPLFQMLVDEIGLMCFHRLQPHNDEYLDTFKLLTIVMHTHGLRHRISSAMVQHFFCTSYEYDDDATVRYKIGMRDRQLQALRAPPNVGDVGGAARGASLHHSRGLGGRRTGASLRRSRTWVGRRAGRLYLSSGVRCLIAWRLVGSFNDRKYNV
jgi:hypothetical protein